MADFTKLTKEELNKMDKAVLITIIGSLQSQLSAINSQLSFLTEQIALMNQRTFGRKTEQLDEMHQFSIFEIFNEAESLADNSPEPKVEEIIISTHTRKKKTTREENLEGLPARIFEHKLSDDELQELFPDGYKELPVETYKRLSIIPQTFLVDEHHVHVYAAKNNDGTIVKAKRPKDVFRNSIATPSLVSAIIVGKYANHVPIDRQSRIYKDSGVKLESNTLANWMINSTESYLYILYEELKKYLCDSELVHADETPFEVIRDGRKAGSKSYMWVYRTGTCEQKHPVVLYDFELTRRTDHPREFLQDYSGILVTDGYQVYHTLEKERDDLQVAGCWVHAKRGFAEYVKTGIVTSEATVAAEAVKKISEIIHLDNQADEMTNKERLKHRQKVVKPKVDAFFAWAKKVAPTLPNECDTRKSINYCINQEQYLRVFLSNPVVPMHNNLAEQAIRPFTLGRKNWVTVDSMRGAEASAILYSLVETAKANNLRLNDYFEYMLDELVKHSDDTDRAFIKDLLPWSKVVQKNFHSLRKS